jgi:hypothetical protein
MNARRVRNTDPIFRRGRLRRTLEGRALVGVQPPPPSHSLRPVVTLRQRRVWLGRKGSEKTLHTSCECPVALDRMPHSGADLMIEIP